MHFIVDKDISEAEEFSYYFETVSWQRGGPFKGKGCKACIVLVKQKEVVPVKAAPLIFNGLAVRLKAHALTHLIKQLNFCVV